MLKTYLVTNTKSIRSNFRAICYFNKISLENNLKTNFSGKKLLSDFYLFQSSTKLFAGMTDLKRISILVLVLLNVSVSIAYRRSAEISDDFDSEGERDEHPVSPNSF